MINIRNKKLVKYSRLIFLWLLIPIILFLFWLFSTIFLTSNYSFTVIVNGYNKSVFETSELKPLYKGDKAIAEFRAMENNLGIVAVRFHTFKRINSDSVIFRIKEKNQNIWYYENKYLTNQFQWDELFTFGFPVINNSKDKIYNIEIESVSGSSGDAVAISKYPPVLVAQYQYPREKLTSNFFELLNFISIKIYYSFSDLNVFISSMVYLLPLIFYLIIIKYFKGLFQPPNYYLVYIFFLSLLIYIFLMNQNNGFIELLLFGAWFFLNIIYKFESRITFFIALIFMLTVILNLVLGFSDIADRASIWVYYFLIAGAIFVIFDLKRKKTKTIDLKEFIFKFLNKK